MSVTQTPMGRIGLWILLLQSLISATAAQDVLEISLREAEGEALRNSNQLRSIEFSTNAAEERAKSLFGNQLPRLSLDASYRYVTEVPDIPVPAPTPVPFGSHSSYTIGPTLTYTLWDTGSSRRAYQGFSKLAAARKEEERDAKIDLRYQVRSTYVQVDLALEELRLVSDSLKLARAQDRDISIRYRAGAAARLDLAISHREVLNYELQFRQKQADLSLALKDFLALLEDRGANNPTRLTQFSDLSHVGPAEIEGVSVVVKLQPLQELLAQEGASDIAPPNENQPKVLSQELLAQSSELSAKSEQSTLFPTLQLSARSSLDYPNGPVREKFNQNTFGASLSMPLFEGGKTRYRAEESRKEALASRFKSKQISNDLTRDYWKAREHSDSLKEQRKLAMDDVTQSEEIARLYYASYKAGRINLIDVQTANLQALLAKVAAARIDAQLLLARMTMKALSGRDEPNG